MALLLGSISPALEAQAPGSPACRLSERAAEAGLAFLHDRGETAARHLPETMGSGVAWLDYDGDGWVDLYAVQSGPFPPPAAPTPEQAAASRDRLFRNRGDGTFEDVTERAGLAPVPGQYGQGVVAADVDGDGDEDLYVTGFGVNSLHVNRGDGTFETVPGAGGAALSGWSSSAAFGDLEGDGDLDLYVTRYLEYAPDHEIFCGDPETGERTYCDPSLFLGAKDVLLGNRGDGTFEDVTEAAGLAGADGRGLGVLFTDLDGNGLADLYVANDLTLNFLFRNLGDGTFEDQSLLSGTAVNHEGKPEAGMGLVAADFDRDGDPDLAVTNFDVETNTYYENRTEAGTGFLQFADVSARNGFGVPSFNLLGFGLVAEDLDGDGHLDVYAANGHIFDPPRRPNVSYRQRDLLLLGDGKGRFEELACPVLAEDPQVGRGLATADFDRDGDPDLALSNNAGPLQLWVSDLPGYGADRAVGVRLVGPAPNTGAVGARVELLDGSTGALRQSRTWTAGDSYQSMGERAALFALPAGGPATLRVTWPGGRVQRFEGVEGGSVVVVAAELQ